MQGQSLAAVFLMTASLAAGGTPPKAELHDLKAMTPVPTKPLPPMDFTVAVGPVTLPKAVDRPEIVVAVAKDQYEPQQQHRWAKPLDAEIARVITENLGQLFGRDRVWTYEKSSTRKADYRVEITVQRFDSLPGQWVALEVRWAVQRQPEGAKQTSLSIVRKGARAPGIEGIMAAHGDALDVISREMAEVLATMDKEQR